ncbi:hypothetical protein B0H15DRAFT_901638 [Mycena belliarum]|uniref:DNA repair protein Crb2 Tudor domain-containing protein n=1 Tax=Mycena belliarum TaxID=1033014 RepID=A0AAD6UDN1_9AGAR|nr:hypothetical protein B0H15DRAFT_901638 [Mycena belliae]
MLESVRNERASTESADDEYTEAGPSTRKRKRGVVVESLSVQTQTRARRATKTSTCARPVKKARATSTSNAQPTRVFALWWKDNHYYPGVVRSQIGQDLYKVDFDDETSDEVKLDQLRLCNPRVGDTAFVPKFNRPVKITAILVADKKVSVAARGFSRDVLVSELKIESKAITSGWADRILAAEAIVCIEKPPRLLISPTLSRMSVLSSVSSRKSSALAKLGFCITYAGADAVKEELIRWIKNNGGVIIEDWEDVVSMKGKQTNTRWTLEQKDATPMFRGIDGVFLLADGASQTPKFLTALALGIPCLKIDFIGHAVEMGTWRDWRMFLLPSGASKSRNCKMTQFVNADWGGQTDHLKNIMNNPAAHKVFRDKNILCIDSEVLEYAKGKMNVTLAIPRILLAMGADSVEAVREIRHASHAPQTYDYIVKKDDTNIHNLPNCIVVRWDWVKDALISGFIPDIP